MFHIGQKVVCVDADGTPEIREGAVYTVAYISPLERVRWRGRLSEGYYLLVHEVKIQGPYRGFAAVRFRPVTERKTDISCLQALLVPGSKVKELA